MGLLHQIEHPEGTDTDETLGGGNMLYIEQGQCPTNTGLSYHGVTSF